MRAIVSITVKNKPHFKAICLIVRLLNLLTNSFLVQFVCFLIDCLSIIFDCINWLSVCLTFIIWFFRAVLYLVLIRLIYDIRINIIDYGYYE